MEKLLIHPKPFKYESLANYIIRLAELNSCSPKWIRSELGIRETIGYARINCYTDGEIFTRLECLTYITQQESKGLVTEQFNKGLWGAG